MVGSAWKGGDGMELKFAGVGKGAFGIGNGPGSRPYC